MEFCNKNLLLFNKKFYLIRKIIVHPFNLIIVSTQQLLSASWKRLPQALIIWTGDQRGKAFAQSGLFADLMSPLAQSLDIENALPHWSQRGCVVFEEQELRYS